MVQPPRGGLARRAVALGLGLAAFAHPIRSHADPAAPEDTRLEPPGAPDDAGPALEWRPTWRRHEWFDYVYTATLTAGALFEVLLPLGTGDERGEGILFDDAVRDAFVLESRDNRVLADSFSDVSLIALAAYPAVVDVGIVALGVHESPDVAWQMFLIDLQALSFSSLVTGTIQRLVDRERPAVAECRRDPNYDPSCDSPRNHLSFFSGHTSVAFTSASLTCLHHAELELYGGWGDALACVTMLAQASLTGTARIAADKHFASDVISGALIGAASGAFMPWLLYYRGGEEAGSVETRAVLGDSIVMPMASRDQLGVAWVGRF